VRTPRAFARRSSLRRARLLRVRWNAGRPAAEPFLRPRAANEPLGAGHIGPSPPGSIVRSDLAAPGCGSRRRGGRGAVGPEIYGPGGHAGKNHADPAHWVAEGAEAGGVAPRFIDSGARRSDVRLTARKARGVPPDPEDLASSGGSRPAPDTPGVAGAGRICEMLCPPRAPVDLIRDRRSVAASGGRAPSWKARWGDQQHGPAGAALMSQGLCASSTATISKGPNALGGHLSSNQKSA